MAVEFFFLSLTILVGYFSLFLFEKTRISQVILLMAFGFLLGPALGLLDVSQESIVVSLLPFLSTLALIVLLFSGGLEFDILAVAGAIPKSMAFTFLVFGLGMALVGGLAYFALGWPIMHGILLGAVAGETSSAIVIAMVERARIEKATKSILIVESTLTDALCIIVSIVIIQLILAQQQLGVGQVAGILISSFSIALLLGMVAAAFVLFLLGRFRVKRYVYVLMLAAIFGLYALTEFVEGNGAFGVFTFSVCIGSSGRLAKALKLGWNDPMDDELKKLLAEDRDEITFFVRTFFFSYMGLLVSVGFFEPYIIAVTVGIVAAFAISRIVARRIVLPGLPVKDSRIVASMLPRGLATAVLATLPLSSGIDIPGFQGLVIGVVLVSNIVATIGIFLFDRN
ncbi:MAG: cation:proton antiporter [Candidatus Micrarchaeota archaeon]